MTHKEALDYVGGLSNTSKMPGFSWSVPPEYCNVGARLRKVEGSVCAQCYGFRGHYGFKNVQITMLKRLRAYLRNRDKWVETMTIVHQELVRRGERYFRWFDNGDLQDDQHLRDIIAIARAVPRMKYWLPTKELQTVHEVVVEEEIPRNLTIRLGAAMVDGPAPIWGHALGLMTSTVHKIKPPQGRRCPAHDQGNQCLDCRACWDRRVNNVSYQKT